jgi:camelysin-like metallo-endopeptidase
MSKLATLSTTKKVIGSLAIAGTAAAVAGLGTFGTFTDSTAPLNTTVASGTVDINLVQPSGAVAIPVTTNGFVPGDSITRAVDLSNNGTSALSQITLASTATAGSILTTDTVNGLQLAVKSCSTAWTQGGTASAPTYTCSGTLATVLSAPVVGTNVLSGLNSMNSSGVDHLIFSISLPTSADNTFQGKSATLSLVFTGTQRTGQAN